MKTKCMSCGGSMKKMQNGGRTISEKAAERKSGKGKKGLYVPVDGYGKTKGLYVSLLLKLVEKKLKKQE
jgi:hypothetical protein